MSQRKLYGTFLVPAIFCTVFFWIYITPRFSSRGQTPQLSTPSSRPPLVGESSPPANFIDGVAKYFIDYPFEGPSYGEYFGALGQRVEIITSFISAAGAKHPFPKAIERVSKSMFPFIRNPTKQEDDGHLKALRNSFIPGSRGIVMALGTQDFRYACHLILSIRHVLKCDLPIQVVYAGEKDLASSNRKVLESLTTGIEFLDILTVFDDKSMQLEKNWAIKPFAALASKFEQVILVDADSVFLQSPEALFSHGGYVGTGALFFHDRLLWQGAFPHRHKWWKQEMKNRTPSPMLLKSRVWAEGYAEEADSGVVVLDKTRVPIFTALLHVCWQNIKAVRDETTYKMTYGDKESWWFGLELCGVPYTFEKHYGAIIGSLKDQYPKGTSDVCGFTIAHVDEKDRLFWFNGSLLKNKHVDKTKYELPTHWMIDGQWQKGATKVDMSCMNEGKATPLTEEERNILAKTIEVAKEADAKHSLI